MPTGYTAELHDGPQSFEDFVLGAARGMSALITMRDTDPSVPAPRRLEPDIQYYEERLQVAKAVLRGLESDEPGLYDRNAEWEYEDAMLEYTRNQQDQAFRKQRYEKMLAEVRKWEIPESLESLRSFMIEQLEMSLRADIHDPIAPQKVSGKEWAAAKREKAKKDIAYYREQISAEITRTEERNEWLSDLWMALDGVYANSQ